MRTQRGAVLFELTLVLPLFMSMVLGVYTGGLAYSKKIALVEAVREGARYGVSLPMGTYTVTQWQDEIRNRVVSASNGDVAFADVCVAFVLPTVTTTTSTPTSHCGLPDPAGAINEPTVHIIKVTASRPAKMEFFLFTKNTTITGKTVARYERDMG